MSRLKNFMNGRYGVDQLSLALVLAAAIVLLIAQIFKLYPLALISLILLIYVVIRIFSKKITQRYQQNVKFLKWWNSITSWFSKIKRRLKSMKTYKYFKCSSCKQELRIPRRKGKVRVTCPKCHNVMEKRS